MYRLILFLIGIALGLLFMCSCSCERLVKRIDRKCGKHAFTDTLTVRDTVMVPSVQTDTIFKPGRDTVIIREGRLTMKYFYNSSDSTVYLSGKCDTVYVPVEIKAPYDKVNIEYSWFEENKWFFLVCAIAIIALFLAIPRLLPKK
jgi:hypothetical protein